MLINITNKSFLAVSPEMMGGALKRTPQRFIRWKNSGSFRNIVQYVSKRSPFYKKRFKSLKISPSRIKKPSDLGDFFTFPEDIMNSAEEFLCRKPHMAFESSGTTGRNKRIYVTHDELDWVGKVMAAGLFLGGATPSDRAINAFDFCVWIPGLLTHKCLEKSKLFTIDAGKIDPMEVYKRIPQYGINIVMGEPTWLIKLTEIAEKKGSYPLKFIIGGAEEMPDAARPWMKKVWQGAEVRMVYASVESAGIMAFEPFAECESYHINENDYLIEIIDPDKDGYGEIAFTTLSRHTMPLVRYRNRDIGRIIPGNCPCGLPFKRLAKIRGRADELVVASGGNLYPLMFEDILKDVPGITTEWQIVFKLRGVKEIMEIHLEMKEARPKNDIESHVFSNIQNRYPDLWKNMSIGIFDTAFVYHEPSTIRTGVKLLRLVDKRYK